MRGRGAVMVMGAMLALVGCQEEAPGQSWPGPCEATWVSYQIMTVAGHRVVLPWIQGQPRVMRFFYDEGLLVRIEDDEDGDGATDGRVGFSYDEHGRLAREFFDRGADDLLEEERVFTYHDDGRVEVRYSETLADGTPFIMPVEHPRPSRWWASCHGDCQYDDHGNLLEDRDRHSQDVLRYSYQCWEGGG